MASTWVKVRQDPFLYVVGFLLIGLAFHAPIVTFSNYLTDTMLGVRPHTGYVELGVRMWKEVLLGLLVLFSIKPFIKRKLYRSRIVQLVLAYIAWTLLYGLIFWDGLPTIAGLRYNLGMFVVFLVVLSLGKENWRKPLENLVLLLGALVAGSAILQLIVPPEWFAFDIINVGENVGTIQDSDIRRMHGVMPGPLQLGSYLILPLALGFQKAVKKLDKRWLAYTGLMLAGIYLSYSRAALLAAGIAMFLLVFYTHREFFTTRRIVYGGLALYCLGVATLLLAFVWAPLSFLIFHAEPERAFFESSTVSHLEGAQRSLERIYSNPMGHGLGATGPASNFGQVGSSSESNYLQIAEEVGLVGVGIVLAIFIRLSIDLKRRNIDILASLIGLLLMGAVLHSLTDTATMWTFMAAAASTAKLKTPLN